MSMAGPIASILTLALLGALALLGVEGATVNGTATIQPVIGTARLSFNVTDITVSDFATYKAGAVCLVVSRLCGEPPANCDISSVVGLAGTDMLRVRLEMLSYMAARVQSDLQRAATNGTLAAALERVGVKVAGTPAATTNTMTDAAGEDAATSGSATVNDSWSPAAIAGTVAGAVAVAGAASAMLIMAMVRRRVAGAAPPHNPAGAAPNAPAKSSAPTASTTALADVGKGLHMPNTVFLVASCVPAQSAAAGGGGGSPTRRAGGGGSLDAYV